MPGKPTFIDLFAGAGGLSLAGVRSGFRLLAGVEKDAKACATFRANILGTRRKAILYEEDILDLSPKRLGREVLGENTALDLLVGGPPCQGFSTHRINGSGVGDPRNELLVHYFKFVRHLKPTLFLVENVPGLLWPRHQEYLVRFVRQAEQAGYGVCAPALLNARDFGVPQNRKRVFILGFKRGMNVDAHWPPQPTHFPPDSDEVRLQGMPPWDCARVVFEPDCPPEDPNDIHMTHSQGMVARIRSTPRNGGSRHQSNTLLPCHANHDGHKDVYGRISLDKPGPTMTTACINPSKGRFLHPTKDHAITVRQAARFQGFPDNFVFHGGLMASGVQIGNAVPIQLGEALFRTLRQILRANGPV